jgi:hypothetical protein
MGAGRTANGARETTVNLNQTNTRYAGVALITLGLIAVFNLWWLIPPALLAGGGVAIYLRQRQIGRTGEAVQALLWGLGLAALLAADFLFPGVLLLGGLSLLLRGREARAAASVDGVVARFARRRTPAVTAPATPAMAAPQAPAAQPQQRVTVVETTERPSGNETVRLR